MTEVDAHCLFILFFSFSGNKNEMTTERFSSGSHRLALIDCLMTVRRYESPPQQIIDKASIKKRITLNIDR